MSDEQAVPQGDGLTDRLRAWQELAGWADGGWELPPKATAALNKLTAQAAAALSAKDERIAELEREIDNVKQVEFPNRVDRVRRAAVAAEREACAKLCDSVAAKDAAAERGQAYWLSEQIRSRGQT